MCPVARLSALGDAPTLTDFVLTGSTGQNKDCMCGNIRSPFSSTGNGPGWRENRKKYKACATETPPEYQDDKTGPGDIYMHTFLAKLIVLDITKMKEAQAVFA